MSDLVRKAAALVLLPNLCVQNANAISVRSAGVFLPPPLLPALLMHCSGRQWSAGFWLPSRKGSGASGSFATNFSRRFPGRQEIARMCFTLRVIRGKKTAALPR